MNKYKILFVFSLSCLLLSSIFNPALAGGCRKRLKRACIDCFHQAINSSQCKGSSSSTQTSTCPQCPTCPSCPLSFSELTENTAERLKTNHTLSLAVKGGGVHNYTLFVASTNSIGSFSYTANYLNAGYQFSSVGIISGSVINFRLPAVIDDIFFTFDCFAFIDITGDIDSPGGACNSIQLVGFNTLNNIGGELSGR